SRLSSSYNTNAIQNHNIEDMRKEYVSLAFQDLCLKQEENDPEEILNSTQIQNYKN
ncbi:19674_t:CDS:1, partial [Racocetra persica]